MPVAVQMVTSILSYVPPARLADRTGRKPFVIATFTAFSLFPLAVVLSLSFAWLVAAFAVGGFLWKVTPALSFHVATAIGAVGTVAFALTVDERHAG